MYLSEGDVPNAADVCLVDGWSHSATVWKISATQYKFIKPSPRSCQAKAQRRDLAKLTWFGFYGSKAQFRSGTDDAELIVNPTRQVRVC